MDVEWVNYSSNNNNFLYNSEANTNPFQEQKNDQQSDFNIYTSKIDYKRSISDSLQVFAGAKYVSVDSENDLQAFIDDGSTFINNEGVSNLFLIDEQIVGLYTKADYQYKSWGFSGGVRWEFSETKGTSITNNSNRNRKISKLFPSMSIRKDLNETFGLNAAYSYRIRRPSYSSLNPFVYFLDPFTSEQGNPVLNPSFTNKYQFNVTYKNMPFIQIQYNQTKDGIFEYISQEDATGEASRTNINIAKQENWQFQVNFPLTLTKKMDGYGALITSYTKNKSESITPPFNKGKWNFTYYMNLDYELPWNLDFNVNGYYSSGGLDNMIDYDWLAGLDLSVSKKFLDEQLKVSLELENNIQRTFQGSVDYDNLDMNIISDWNRNNLFLNINYRFGKKYNKKKKRRNNSGEEINRLDTN